MPFPGYVLGLHRSDCAAARVPSVVAQVPDRKVVALRVSHTAASSAPARAGTAQGALELLDVDR